MSKFDKRLEDTEPGITVKVDVAEIVKYVCIASISIVSIIFITRCINNLINSFKNK
jgi:hypothetical protein